MRGQRPAPAAHSSLRSTLFARGLLLSLPAAVMALLPSITSLFAAPRPGAILPVLLAAVLLLIYPGYLLLRLLDAAWRPGRGGWAAAAVLGYGLWTLPAVLLIQLRGELDTLLIIAAATTGVLAWLTAWRARATPLARLHRQGLQERLRRHDWPSEILFLGALLVALGLLLTFGGVERHSDRQGYQAQVRFYLESASLGTDSFLPYRAESVRLELSSWLVQLAAIARLAGADPGLLYSFALPPLMLILSLCAVWGLGRSVTGSRRGGALASALLVLHWVSTIALPSTAGYSWLERVQLRPEGAFATLGYWAVTSHIMQDKFILIFLMLPVAQLLLLRFLQYGGWQRLFLVGVALAGLSFVHQLGAAFFGLTLAAVGLVHLLRTRTRRSALRLGAVAFLLGLAMIVPFLQRGALLEASAPSLAAPETAADFVNSGPREVGLWVWPAQPALYAVDLFVLWRQPLLVLSLILLPILVVWRRLRTLGDQFVAAMLLLVLFVSYNPLLAPLLGRIITYRMLFRTSWLLELPAILLLARLLILSLASLRLHSRVFAGQGRVLATLLLFAPFLVAVPLLAPRIAEGVALLRDVQAAALTEAEADMLAYLRQHGTPGSIVWADRTLIDEIPPAVGHSYGPYFRYNAIDPAYYAIIRDFYTPAVDPQRLVTLSEHKPPYLIAADGSAVDLQLAELEGAYEAVYRNEQLVLYAPLPDAADSEPFASLVGAGQASRAGDWAGAEAAARRVLASFPGNRTAGVLAAQALLAQAPPTQPLPANSQAQEALAAAQTAAAADPDAVWAQRLVGAIQRGLGERAESQGDRAAAAAAYRAALGADPGDTLSAERLAAVLGLDAQEEQRLADKAAIVERLSRAAAPDLGRTTQERSGAYQALGAALERMGELDAAERAYTDAVAVTRPWDADARGGAIGALGRFYVRSGNPTAAQTLYDSALQRYGAAAELHHAAAELAALHGGREAAAVVYTGAAAANPQAAWPYLALAQLYLEQEAAAASAGETGGTAFAKSPWEGAGLMLQKAVAAEPSSEEAYRLLAEITQMQQGAEAALAVWRQAAGANPQAVWPLVGLAEAAGGQGSHAAAAEALQQAAQLAPDDQQIAAHLARAQEAAGRQAAIERFWETLPGRQAEAQFTPLDLPTADGWTLAGLYASGEALASGEATPVWLFWQGPSTDLVAGAPEEGWQRVEGALWVQAAEVSNGVVDGSFERAAQLGRVLGLPEDLYAPPATAGERASEVRLVQREGASTHAAALANGVATPNRSLASPPLPVAPRKLYLYGGWLRSLAGNAYLGWQWLSRDGSTGAPAEYLLGGVQNGPWQAAYRLLAPPPGAEALQALLLNVRTTGTALYDDLLLLPLDPPGAPQASQEGEVR